MVRSNIPTRLCPEPAPIFAKLRRGQPARRSRGKKLDNTATNRVNCSTSFSPEIPGSTIYLTMNKFTVPKMFGRKATMQIAGSTQSSAIFRWMLLLVALLVPQVMQAAQWNATVGAQTHDKGHQALAFLPNEIWIHAGDRITWHFDVPEIHTVTFLRADQPRPFFG